MKLFIRKFVIFILPLIIVFFSIEYFNRINNTFYAKNKIIEEDKDSIKVLILGSSQTWRGINPEFLTIKSAPLAHGGSAFNIDYLLFEKYVNELPSLEVVLLETSYHTFESYRDKNWSKNHLFYIYYGINNYESTVPISEHLLVTANLKGYVRKIWAASKLPEFGQFNKYGFITGSKRTLETGHYDADFLKKRHSDEQIIFYKKNKQSLKKIVAICEEKNLDLVFFSPPKYYTYNENNNENILKRRDAIFNMYSNMNTVHIWNYEKGYENDTKVFASEDHLNFNGAKKMTKVIDERLNRIIKARTHKNVYPK